ncbi:MAG TPA: response regulator [bacterium]|nr:response regulator [bacterium]
MKTVLIVDDETNIRNSLLRILEHNEILFLEASNGLNAFEKCVNNKIDAIILDYRMPFVDGIEFLKWIHKSFENIKVVILSGYLSETQIKELSSYNELWSKIFKKPCDENDLKKTIFEILELS